MAVVSKRSRQRAVPIKPGGKSPRAGSKGRKRRQSGRSKKLNANGRATVSLSIALTRDAWVRACVLRLGARRANVTIMGEAGDVRVEGSGTSGKTFVVDFGVLRTVSGVAVPPRSKILRVLPWNGLAFGESLAAGQRKNPHIARFSEIQTQRLRVVLAAALDTGEMASEGALFLPGAPADLLLSLGEGPPLASFPGRIEPGAGTQPGSESWNARGERLVDVTEALAARLGDPLDPSPVTLELRLSAGAPGDLELSVQTLDLSRISRVDLAGQGEILLDLEAEAHREYVLGFSRHARVEGLRFQITADQEAARVLDPLGPPLIDDVELLVDPHRSFALRLPSLGGLGTILGIRLPLCAEEAEAEARVSLWRPSDPGGEPEEPIPEAISEPAVVPALNGDDPWLTFVFPRPLKVDAAVGAWVALDVVRGKVRLKLAPKGDGDGVAEGARRGTAKGDWRRLPAVFEPGQALAGLAAPARVVGLEASEDPRLPLRIGLAGAAGGLDLDPAGQATQGFFELATPLLATAERPPRLGLTAYSAGTLRLESVDLLWSEAPSELSAPSIKRKTQ